MTRNLDIEPEVLYVQISFALGQPPNFSGWVDMFDAKIESIVENINAAPSEATFWFPDARWNDDFDILKGDKVKILSGKDRGKLGKVLHVYPGKGRALVEGINMVKKHMRKSQQNPNGAIIQKELPIHLSNLSLLDPTSSKPTRFKTLVAQDGSKQRVSAKTKAVITS